MGTTPAPIQQAREVRILVLDNDVQGQGVLRQILDSEGWRVRIVPDDHLLMTELKTGEWSLVIANVVLTGVEGHAFVILRELASVSAADGARIRVLYLIPEATSSQYLVHLEAARLPYVLRPYHLHDFLEKVSDLLVEVIAAVVALGRGGAALREEEPGVHQEAPGGFEAGVGQVHVDAAAACVKAAGEELNLEGRAERTVDVDKGTAGMQPEVGRGIWARGLKALKRSLSEPPGGLLRMSSGDRDGMSPAPRRDALGLI